MATFTVRHDRCGADQESSFMNATLQRATGDCDTFDVSIATHVTVPADVVDAGPDAVQAHLERALAAGDATFEIEIGPACDASGCDHG